MPFHINVNTLQARQPTPFVKGLDKGIFDLVFGDREPTVFPGPRPVPSPTLPSGPAVATLIDTIQTVDDGEIIRAEHHNDLVGAVRLIARLLDTGQIAQEITVSAAPVLLPVLAKTAFALDEGFARGPAGDPESIVGWMPLDLPDGYTIEGLRILGSYPGSQLGGWPVSLRRVEHGKQADQTLVSGDLKPAAAALGTAFSQSFAFDPRGHTRAEADELSLVDTGKFRYQLHTTALQAKPSEDLKLFTVQVSCVRS